MDIEHFQIMVNAMLGWSDGPKPPGKGGSPEAEGLDDELAGEDDEALADDGDDDDGPIVRWRPAPARAGRSDAGAGEAGFPVSEKLD